MFQGILGIRNLDHRGFKEKASALQLPAHLLLQQLAACQLGDRGDLPRGALDLDLALALVRQPQGLVIRREEPVPCDIVPRLETNSGCSADDCAFMAIPQQVGVPWTTADHALLQALLRQDGALLHSRHGH